MRLVLYILDTLADWEIAHITAELRSRRFIPRGSPDCPVVTVSDGGRRATTMGGIAIEPDAALGDLELRDDDLLVLPGADTWLDAARDPVLRLAKARIERDLPVAAICGATLGLARVGALDAKRHCSNDRAFLPALVKDYRGEANYVDAPATSDRGLVTASGMRPVEFSYEVFKALGAFRPASLEAWKNLYLTNEPRYFYELAESMR